MDCKYEVAFSFLYQDERLAYELNDLITDRVSTFLYSKRQEELGGTDGELAFNKVFSEESRIVVVLYRNGWGETPWTRVEEIAIRNRAFENGWDFVIFIALDRNSPVPKYLPKSQIWLDYDRWGLKGAAPIIEQRIKDAGGETRDETIVDRAKRLNRQRAAEKEREAALRAHDVINKANQEFNLIETKLGKLKPLLEDRSTGFLMGHSEKPREFYEFGFQGYYLCFVWSGEYARSLDGTILKIAIYEKKGHQGFSDYSENVIELTRYQFDLNLLGAWGWSEIDTTDKFILTEDLINKWVKQFLDGVENRKQK